MNTARASTKASSRKMIHIPPSNMFRSSLHLRAILVAALLAGCAQVEPPRRETPATAVQTPVPPPQVCPAPSASAAPAACVPCACDKPTEPPPKPAWQRASWSALPGWAVDTHEDAWRAFVGSCATLRRQAPWQAVCSAAERTQPAQARAFFENQMQAWRRVDATSGAPAPGLVTGYYEPLLNGSRVRQPPFVHAVLGVPDDLLTIELGDLRPDLKGQRLRGRIEGRRVVPYFSRGEIEAGRAAASGRELVFVDDPIDLFFLMIQGSGRVRLNDGSTLRLNYADQNGHPYRSIGRLLIERGDLKTEQASMQGIKAWARANPAKLTDLLNANPSYVFFRETGVSRGDGADLPGPLGAQGLALTSGRSVAVDPAFIPLGVPVWLATTWPNTNRPLERLMLAQDTGGAIRGVNRADYFWGFGDEAGREAGRMRQQGEMWILWPAAAGEPPR